MTRRSSHTTDIRLHWRRTKIIATLGPATASAATLRQLLHAGVDAVRLNMSHGSHEGHRKFIAMVRKEAARTKRHIAIIMDLCGPKIRTGIFENGFIDLEVKQQVIISCSRTTGREGIIASQYRPLYRDVKPGNRILLDDGRIELKVKKIVQREIHCSVVHGGRLLDHKGINLPDTQISAPSFTRKDREDALLGIQEQVDFIALSFVRSARDVTSLGRFIKKNHGDIPIISKIEKPEAVENIEQILQHSYGIMIARGDLGIELPAESVPLIQNRLITLARLHNKPVIVATQMLESMVEHSRPTRAEVGDIANAAMYSADAVMLSAETAVGKYPIPAVETMDRVTREIERYQWQEGTFVPRGESAPASIIEASREAVSHAALSLARELKLHSIIIPTRTGATARILAADRPTAPCLGVCQESTICRRLTLHWGVIPVHIEGEEIHDWRQMSITIARRFRLSHRGRTVLVVSGFNEDPKLNEPVLKLITL